MLSFFGALVVAGTPVLPAAAVAAAAAERVPALGGEAERTPIASSNHTPLQLRAARESSARPGFWKLPPHALTLRLVATTIPTVTAEWIDTNRRSFDTDVLERPEEHP